MNITNPHVLTNHLSQLFLYCESHHGLLEPSGGSAAARALHLVQCNINKAMESYRSVVSYQYFDSIIH